MSKRSALTWADLFSSGTLIDLTVGCWDALVKIKPSDLNIPNTDEIRAALTWGHERLISKEALQPIKDVAYEARKLVDAYSIPFKLIPGSRFIPKANRVKLNAELEELKERFRDAVNQFVAHYEKHSVEQQKVLRQALLSAAKSAAAADDAMNRIIGHYPGREEVHKKFSLDWHLFSLAAPRDGEAVGKNEGESIRDQLGEMVDEVRTQLVDKVRSILKLTSQGGKISARTYNSARRLCDKLEALNVFNDSGLDLAIKSIREALTEASAAGDNARRALSNGLGGVEEELEKSRDDAIKAAADRLVGASKRRMEL